MLMLPIKKKWYDMILSGEKEDEYREIKAYWTKRFSKYFEIDEKELKKYVEISMKTGHTVVVPCKAKNVIYRNGYSKNSRCIEAVAILLIGHGREEWGAELDKIYYVLKLLYVKEGKGL